jgi:uncharacterized RDD family membrane protein YckC
VTTSEGRISPIPREARTYQGQRAGVISRTLACVVDGLVIVAVVAACYLGLNGFIFMLQPRTFQFVDMSFVGLLLVGCGIGFLYFAIGWAAFGRTYGCHVMGLRVLDRRGLKPRVPLAIVRSAFCVALPIGLYWCVISPKRRSLQDVFLRTRVVYDWHTHPEGRTGF